MGIFAFGAGIIWLFTPQNRPFIANCGAGAARVVGYNHRKANATDNQRKGYCNMGIGVLLVQAAELIQAANEMNQAMEIYEGAVENCQNAAADLASKWEGETKIAFVEHQENAYQWHKQILEIVREVIAVVRKAVDLYNTMEDAAKSAVQG